MRKLTFEPGERVMFARGFLKSIGAHLLKDEVDKRGTVVACDEFIKGKWIVAVKWDHLGMAAEPMASLSTNLELAKGKP